MESQGIIRRSKSSWSSPLHMVETTAEAVLDAFLATWVARFGISPSSPQTEGCSSPQPRGFGWCGEYGVQHITTTPFHPPANGMVERLHRQMKDALRARGGAAA